MNIIYKSCLICGEIYNKGVIHMYMAGVFHIFNIVFQITKFIAYLLFIKVCITYLNKNK